MPLSRGPYAPTHRYPPEAWVGRARQADLLETADRHGAVLSARAGRMLTHAHAVAAGIASPSIRSRTNGTGAAMAKADFEFSKFGLGPAGDRAVRVGGIASHIGPADGVETALAVSLLTQSRIPVWAALSTGGVLNNGATAWLNEVETSAVRETAKCSLLWSSIYSRSKSRAD